MPAFDKNKPLTAKIILTVLKEDELRARLLLFEILSREESKAPQSAETITELFTLFQRANSKLLAHFVQVQRKIFELAADLNLEFSITVKEKTLQFLRPPKYDLLSDDTHISPPQQELIPEEKGPFFIKTTYSFAGFINGFLPAFFMEAEDARQKIISGKEELVNYTYSHLSRYLEKLPIQKHPSQYKKNQVVGAIAVVFGFLMTRPEFDNLPQSRKYYGEYLADSTKHYTQRIKQSTDNKAKRTPAKK